MKLVTTHCFFLDFFPQKKRLFWGFRREAPRFILGFLEFILGFSAGRFILGFFGREAAGKSAFEVYFGVFGAKRRFFLEFILGFLVL